MDGRGVPLLRRERLKTRESCVDGPTPGEVEGVDHDDDDLIALFLAVVAAAVIALGWK